MVQHVPISVSIHWRFLHQDKGLSCNQIMNLKKYQGKYSKATICRHMKKPTHEEIEDGRKFNKGRPPKLTPRQKRTILRESERLRKSDGHYTTKRVKLNAGVHDKVCDETVRRVFRSHGLRYTHSRKKGVLKRSDLRQRLNFAYKVRKLPQDELWKNGIAFYLDGVGFTHKYNPMDQAMSPSTMAWRRPSDGLSFGQTARGSHEGTGGRVAHFMCAMAYGKGMILAEQYHGHLNGKQFSDMVQKVFPDLFKNSSNPKGKLFLQDGCPTQNSKVALEAINKVGGRLFHIPPRSPDLNPIENVFNCIKAKLHEQALDNRISKESFEQFSEGCVKTILEYPIDKINKTIESMPKRIAQVIAKKGQRLKY